MTMQQQGQERNAADLHIPVLMKETLAALQPVLDAGRDRPVRILDGTLGMAGHSSAMLQAAPQAELCALDRDEEALELARRRLEPFGGRVHTYHCRYSQFEEALDGLGWDKVDAVLLDIGVSSLQLDEAERGFSFYGDGPLDMRMDQHSGAPSAWHWVNRESFDRLKECHDRAFCIRRTSSPHLSVRNVARKRLVYPLTLSRNNILMAHKEYRLFGAFALPVKKQISVDLGFLKFFVYKREKLFKHLVKAEKFFHLGNTGM